MDTGSLFKPLAEWLFVVAAATAGVAAVLEVLLGDARKKRVDYWTLRTWDRLDDLRKRKYLDWLQSRRWLFTAIGSLGGLAYVASLELSPVRAGSYSLSTFFSFDELIFISINYVPGFVFVVLVERHTLRQKTLVRAASLVLFYFLLAIVPIYLFGYFVVAVVVPHTQELVYPSTLPYIVMTQFAVVYGLVMTVSFVVIACAFWLPVAVPVLLIFIAYFVVGVFAFGLRRAAEYPRGTLFAVIAFFGGLAGLFRVIG